MQRFFLKKHLEDTEIFSDELFHQVSRVLRMQVNNEIILFSGDGKEFLYILQEMNKKQAIFVRKWELYRENTEPNKNITLYQSLPNKIEKIEWIIQKNIEIGVSKIIFFRSERSQKLILSANKIARFENIAREALEQCGGKFFPEIIFSEKNFDEILANLPDNEMQIFLHTAGEQNFTEKISSKNIGIWVGPEGGWSEDEIIKMNKNNFITAHFWNRILRTETAGMVMNFLILHTNHNI